MFGMQIMVFNYGCGYDIALLHAFFVIFEWLVLYKIISANRNNFNEINRYKNKLKDSNNNLQELFDLAGEAIIVFDENHNTIDYNIATQKMFGYAKDELKGKNLFDFVPKDELYKIEITLKEPQSKPQEINLYKKDGSIFPTISIGVDIIRDGKLWRMITVQDLTDIKNREKSLLKSEKMASMGEMIGNIAHQWRQPLSVISTGATGLILHKQCGVLTDDTLEETCEMINQNAQYLSKTINDFTNFIKDDRKRRVFKLEDEVDSFISLVSGSIKNHNLTVITDIQKDIKVDGFQNELTQCIINIFNNAKDALNSNRKENKFIFISTSVENKKAIIKIKDNANGIPIDILPKIFDPYFTTKHKSQGTGLGLYMSRKIVVESLGGELRVMNTKVGAKFIIRLPV
jgi:PAS domain S-box-containing protein